MKFLKNLLFDQERMNENIFGNDISYSCILTPAPRNSNSAYCLTHIGYSKIFYKIFSLTSSILILIRFIIKLTDTDFESYGTTYQRIAQEVSESNRYGDRI